MNNLVYWSDHIRPMLRQLRFIRAVAGRFLWLLFRRDKKLIQLELDYQRRYHFDQSLLFIRYRFGNALWYRFEGIKKTTDAGVIVLNRDKIPKWPVRLKVYGWGTKRVYPIDIIPEATLQTSTFHTKIRKLARLKTVIPSLALLPFMQPKLPKARVRGIGKVYIHYPAAGIRHPAVRIKYLSFKPTEFL